MNNTFKQGFKFMMENKDIQKMFKDMAKAQKQVDAAVKAAEKLKKKWG
ncbi:hypothetical protein SK3146_05039 [Paenibacillus konkukensis]|uniref:Uncharacterized protein n=2 Tax=Paenibacillus TaxID=44249 RepID=A0ABY4RVB7_9BACL|nr:hypothetical protein SK3146_05039 [Paenibacillus konkukensis]